MLINIETAKTKRNQPRLNSNTTQNITKFIVLAAIVVCIKVKNIRAHILKC